MKLLKYIIAFSLITLAVVSCRKGPDPIISVPAKPDAASPEVVINAPIENKNVTSQDSVATYTFKAIASDDVELKSVTLILDGGTIKTYTYFIDYRRLVVEYDYNHLLDGDHTFIVTAVDLVGNSTTDSVHFSKVTLPPYTPMDGETLYFSFDGYYLDVISGSSPIVVGSPDFAEGKIGDAYAGATDSYLTYPSAGLLGDEFSIAFWYKINAVPDRAGIMEISPPMTDPTNPDAADRTKGIRMFREINGDNQNIGLNLGIGETEVWMNPFITVPPDQDWMHVAISISATHVTIYVDGAVQMEQDIDAKLDWTSCDLVSIASGEPNFIYWEHFSDLSLYDEMHFFNKAITADEVQSLYTAGK